jgi:hypothetical protein
MRAVLYYASWSIGLPLELLIIGALVRGPYRRFPVVLLYSVVLFLTTIVDISVYFVYSTGGSLRYSLAHYYWIDEGLRMSLVFAVVISLLYLASEAMRPRALLRFALIGGGIFIAGASFLVHHQAHRVVGEWMTLWSRDLDFTAAILDLALWAILLATRYKDTQLLLLSGGLGIDFTGEAIGQALRNLFPWTPFSPGDFFVLLGFFACYWIWWQALRPAAFRHVQA